MNIKVNFISKLSKAKTSNEVVFVQGKKIKNCAREDSVTGYG